MPTFAVNNIKPVLDDIPKVNTLAQFEQSIGKEVEDFQNPDKALIQSHFHPFINTLFLCYNEHRPLIISPDHLWLMIVQGLSQHIKLNSEALREKIVSHEGKMALRVVRDEIVEGSYEHWGEVIETFSKLIKANTDNWVYDLIIPNFSTTNGLAKTAYEIALMDATSSYFSFEYYELCGIPSITLLGEKKDYEQILSKLSEFNRIGLDWWAQALRKIIQKFIDTFDGNIDKKFWNSIYKHIPENEDCGSQNLANGWCLKFFPYFNREDYQYLDDDYTVEIITVKNPYIEKDCEKDEGFSYDMFSSGLSKAEVKWVTPGRQVDMELYSGFFGITQDADSRALSPEISWAMARKFAPNVQQKNPQEILNTFKPGTVSRAQSFLKRL